MIRKSGDWFCEKIMRRQKKTSNQSPFLFCQRAYSTFVNAASIAAERAPENDGAGGN
jgi:hypothetical protein